MPVFNGEAYLGDAIESILNQSFRDFEFIIINDGSTDGTSRILNHFQQQDNRIRCYDQSNQGLGNTLNAGLKLARGKYIARMDADDASHPERLAKQVAFMEMHPEIGVCGTWVKTIGKPSGEIWRYPTDDATIRCRLLFESSLAHPSVIMRHVLFTRTGLDYRLEYSPAEDYDLWVRASTHCLFANLSEVLLSYRLHESQITQRSRAVKEDNADRVRLTQLQQLGLCPSTEELELHHTISMWQFRATQDFVLQADAWLRKLKAANDMVGVYSRPAFSTVLGERWYWVCRRMTRLGLWTFRRFHQSPFAAAAALPWQQCLKFTLKCVIKWPSYG